MRALKILLFITICFPAAAFAQTLLNWQSFESGADNWNYTVFPPKYNCTGDDTWSDTTSMFDILSPADGSRFWGINDLDNGGCGGGDFRHTLTFPAVNISAYARAFLRFKYYTFGFDNSDTLGYIVEYNNGTTWTSQLVELRSNTQAWETVTIAAPANAQFIRIRFVARQNGGSDYAAIDDIKLYGAASDAFPPVAVRARVISATQVQVTFDEALNTGTATNVANYVGLGTISSATESNNVVTLNLAAPLNQGQFYTLVIGGVQDISGNVMNTAYFSLVHNTTVANVQISEMMYNPPDTIALEFIEFYNAGSTPARMGGYKIKDGVSFTFPDITLDPGQYIVVAQDSATVKAFFNVPALQWTSGSLSNAGEEIVMENTIDQHIDSVEYNNELPWDTLADGDGYSLSNCYPWAADNALPQVWTRSLDYAGKTILGDSIWANPGRGCFPTRVSAIAASAGFTVYPNPARDVITIRNEVYETCTVEIFDMLGRIHERVAVEYYTQSIPLGSLTNGNYWLVVRTSNGVVYKQQISILH
jgi:hypothetical protein